MNRSLTLILALSLFNVCCAWGMDNNIILKDQAIEIANKEVVRVGYNLSELSAAALFYKTPENICISQSKGDFYKKYHLLLKGKKYWAVNYRPDPKIVKKGRKGGSICVFVDAELGGIITYVGKK
ncbi:MAG: hypothetical protein HQK56_15085 [Deltaproteobacteria bacterium]|nr:hypothetical protein [Deltaproteobacteria bacterium]